MFLTTNRGVMGHLSTSRIFTGVFAIAIGLLFVGPSFIHGAFATPSVILWCDFRPDTTEASVVGERGSGFTDTTIDQNGLHYVLIKVLKPDDSTFLESFIPVIDGKISGGIFIDRDLPQGTWTFNYYKDSNSNQVIDSDDLLLVSEVLDLHCPIPVEVQIDVNPNSINIRNDRLLSVVILGSSSLDVSQIDSSTTKFGPGPYLASPIRSDQVDTNRDGHRDLLLKFRTSSVGFTISDRVGCLYAELGDGTSIFGCDDVRIIT